MPNTAGQTLTRNAPPKRLTSAVGGSLLFHALVLALLGLNMARLHPQPLAPVHETEVWLYALPPMTHVKPHAPSSAAKARAPEARRAPPARVPNPTPRPASPRAAAGQTLPSPLAGAGTQPGQASAHISASDGADGVAEALRTSVGCDADHVVHLTAAERDKCSQKFGEAARRAPAFAKTVDRSFAAQAAEDERRRQNRQGPLQDNVKPCTGEGSNLGGGCLTDGAILHVPQP